MSEQFHALTPSTLKETDHLPKRKCLAVIPGVVTKKNPAPLLGNEISFVQSDPGM